MRFRPLRALAVCLLVVAAVAWTLAAAVAEPPGPAPTPVGDAPVYAEASQVDFSFLRSGKPHGFLRVTEGGAFAWEDGRRARFWGLNIANRNLWIAHDEIDRVVEAIAKAGTNLVRFEALDSRGGLLEIEGQPGTRRLDPDKLDTLHYWISRCKQRHICYYLDLLDFREFKPEDGAEATLNRGARPYAMFDPHLIELQKEYATQLLTTRNPYTGLAPVDDPDLALLEICNEHGFFLNPELLSQLVEPYRGRLQALWNDWLLRKYQSRERLLDAWKQLGADEDPKTRTVALPTLVDAVGRGPRTVEARQGDGIEFLSEVQRAYFKTMMAHLREIGLRIPVTAVVSNDVAPDLASVAAECDFLSENFYADHPRFEGRDWEGRYHFRNQNQLREGGPAGFAPYTAALRWAGKPVVIREWATVWPNVYRAASVPQAVAYARLQDYDGMILFGYKTGEVANRLVFFGYQADPTVWGLYSLGAAAFLRGDIAAARSRLTLVYTLENLMAFPNGVTDAHRLAWLTRVNAEIRANAPTAPPRQKSGTSPPKPGTSRSLAVVLAGPATLAVAASPNPATQVLAALGFSTASLQQALQAGVYAASTGQIVLDTRAGRIRVQTPTVCMVAGEIGGRGPHRAGVMSVVSQSPVGAVVALSLDGQPLGRSRRYLVKMVTQAENTGQELVPLPPQNGLPDLVLKDEGASPVRTLGAPSAAPTTVTVAGRPVVSVFLVNGTWELFVDGSSVRFRCDTPNVVAHVLGRRLVTTRGTGRI